MKPKHRWIIAAAGAGVAASAYAAETIKCIYDARGRLVRVERTGNVNNGVVTNYTMDKADNRLTKTKSP